MICIEMVWVRIYSQIPIFMTINLHAFNISKLTATKTKWSDFGRGLFV